MSSSTRSCSCKNITFNGKALPRVPNSHMCISPCMKIGLNSIEMQKLEQVLISQTGIGSFELKCSQCEDIFQVSLEGAGGYLTDLGTKKRLKNQMESLCNGVLQILLPFIKGNDSRISPSDSFFSLKNEIPIGMNDLLDPVGLDGGSDYEIQIASREGGLFNFLSEDWMDIMFQ